LRASSGPMPLACDLPLADEFVLQPGHLLTLLEVSLIAGSADVLAEVQALDISLAVKVGLLGREATVDAGLIGLEIAVAVGGDLPELPAAIGVVPLKGVLQEHPAVGTLAVVVVLLATGHALLVTRLHRRATKGTDGVVADDDGH
jgi:hypothetical protein